MTNGTNISAPLLKDIKYWVFDLDNTLYSSAINLFTQVDEKMGIFISQMFDISYELAKKRQKYFFKKYGTTLRGLMTEYDINAHDFLDYVHDIDFTVLNVDHSLNEAIKNLPGDKFIFTNASNDYAQNILDKIGLNGHFKDIFDIHDGQFIPKPHMNSYRKMIDKFAIDPKVSAFIEDIAGNLNPAAELGMATIWVPTASQWSKQGHCDENVHHVAKNLPQWLNGVLSDLEVLDRRD